MGLTPDQQRWIDNATSSRITGDVRPPQRGDIKLIREALHIPDEVPDEEVRKQVGLQDRVEHVTVNTESGAGSYPNLPPPQPEGDMSRVNIYPFHMEQLCSGQMTPQEVIAKNHLSLNTNQG